MPLPSPRTLARLSSTLALAAAATTAFAADAVLDLPIGDPERRDRSAPVVLDGVSDSARGDLVTPRELAARLDGVRLLLVGESHTEMEFHRVQLRVVEELVRRGRKVAIGLEMYPAAEQAWLDRWVTEPALGEAAFLAGSRWYRNWGYHWDYYSPIFRFARDHGLRLFGLNVPRAVVQTMRKEGRAGLTEEQRRLLPERIDVDSAEHRRLFRAFFPEQGMHGGLSDEQFEGMFLAQCTWDAAMAHNALAALAATGDESAILVVLVGSGHVAYGLGVERQAALWFDGAIASVVPVPVEDAETGEAVAEARASYADFLWGVPLERHPLYPVLGVSLAERPAGTPLPVLFVAKESVGSEAGFQPGDLLLEMDGTPIDDKEVLNRLMSERRWGDAARFAVQRGEERLELVAHFRRERWTPPAPSTPPGPTAPPAPVAPPAPPAAPGS